MAGVIHIAGLDIQVGAQLRQRCGWCGAVIVDYDLARTASPCGDHCQEYGCKPENHRPGTWLVGGLVEVDGVPVHFMRKPGVGPDPTPLILTHGWPWTFWHWAKVIDQLADPGAHGGDLSAAFPRSRALLQRAVAIPVLVNMEPSVPARYRDALKAVLQ